MLKKHKKVPGGTFFFNFRCAASRLCLEEKGQLFEAILDFWENDELSPGFKGTLAVVWDYIEPRLAQMRRL